MGQESGHGLSGVLCPGSPRAAVSVWQGWGPTWRLSWERNPFLSSVGLGLGAYCCLLAGAKQADQTVTVAWAWAFGDPNAASPPTLAPGFQGP